MPGCGIIPGCCIGMPPAICIWLAVVVVVVVVVAAWFIMPPIIGCWGAIMGAGWP